MNNHVLSLRHAPTQLPIANAKAPRAATPSSFIPSGKRANCFGRGDFSFTSFTVPNLRISISISHGHMSCEHSTIKSEGQRNAFLTVFIKDFFLYELILLDLHFNHRKQRGLDLDTVRHMQQHEKRRKRGCDHEEVGLVLSCP